MNDYEYVRNYYHVPAEIGRVVMYNGRRGIIYKDGGAHVAVNFDSDKPGVCVLIHPTDPSLVYTDEMATQRKMTRSQKRYQDFLDADTGESFAEFIGCDKNTMLWKREKRLV
jgi:hypothetical protein